MSSSFSGGRRHFCANLRCSRAHRTVSMRSTSASMSRLMRRLNITTSPPEASKYHPRATFYTLADVPRGQRGRIESFVVESLGVPDEGPSDAVEGAAMAPVGDALVIAGRVRLVADDATGRLAVVLNCGKRCDHAVCLL